MEFLLTQKENNETSSNYSSQLQETSQDTQNSSDTNTNNDSIESPAPPPDPPLATSSTIQSGKKNSMQMEITEILRIREKNREQRRIERNEERMRQIDSNRPRDALTDLFTSLCQKTRDLPKNLQLRVQREIFETINRAEEEALSYDSVNNYYCSTPSTSSSYGYTSATNYQTTNLPDASPLPDVSTLRDASTLADASILHDVSHLTDNNSQHLT